jgi:acyl carrier protein
VKQVVLGEGIANTELYIVDESMKLVPVGVSGELYIGGEGLARGYLNRPDLTAERFVPHPFSASGGARLYRTGDIVRYLSDGQIEFLGRADHQVKIRGFRIELGEIEAVLYQHERVREAVVVAREAVTGQQRLVGYVVAEDGEELSAGDLRKHLSEKLPEHMIPSVFMLLDELPHTPNGKLDRRALPVPDSARPDLQHCSFVAPAGPLERDLANMWSGLLGVEQIGIHDNFFELGGHSLIAMQLVSRVRADFDLEIGLRDFFQRPTIEELAKMIEEAFFARSEDGNEMEAMLSQLEEIEEEEAQRMARGEEQNAL